MRTDRPVRDVEPLADLSVGQTLRRELRDLKLVPGEPIGRGGGTLAAALTGSAQLDPSALAPRHRAERVESVSGATQRLVRLRDARRRSHTLRELVRARTNGRRLRSTARAERNRQSAVESSAGSARASLVERRGRCVIERGTDPCDAGALLR